MTDPPWQLATHAPTRGVRRRCPLLCSRIRARALTWTVVFTCGRAGGARLRPTAGRLHRGPPDPVAVDERPHFYLGDQRQVRQGVRSHEALGLHVRNATRRRMHAQECACGSNVPPGRAVSALLGLAGTWTASIGSSRLSTAAWPRATAITSSTPRKRASLAKRYGPNGPCAVRKSNAWSPSRRQGNGRICGQPASVC